MEIAILLFLLVAVITGGAFTLPYPDVHGSFSTEDEGELEEQHYQEPMHQEMSNFNPLEETGQHMYIKLAHKDNRRDRKHKETAQYSQEEPPHYSHVELAHNNNEHNMETAHQSQEEPVHNTHAEPAHRANHFEVHRDKTEHHSQEQPVQHKYVQLAFKENHHELEREKTAHPSQEKPVQHTHAELAPKDIHHEMNSEETSGPSQEESKQSHLETNKSFNVKMLHEDESQEHHIEDHLKPLLKRLEDSQTRFPLTHGARHHLQTAIIDQSPNQELLTGMKEEDPELLKRKETVSKISEARGKEATDAKTKLQINLGDEIHDTSVAEGDGGKIGKRVLSHDQSDEENFKTSDVQHVHSTGSSEEERVEHPLLSQHSTSDSHENTDEIKGYNGKVQAHDTESHGVYQSEDMTSKENDKNTEQNQDVSSKTQERRVEKERSSTNGEALLTSQPLYRISAPLEKPPEEITYRQPYFSSLESPSNRKAMSNSNRMEKFSDEMAVEMCGQNWHFFSGNSCIVRCEGDGWGLFIRMGGDVKCKKPSFTFSGNIGYCHYGTCI